MKPLEKLGSARTPTGSMLELFRHDGAYLIRADGVELMAEAHHFDGMVLLSSCDKSNPGVMMGLARVDRPAVFLGGGMGHQMCPGETLGTAMSMQCLSEALGIAL